MSAKPLFIIWAITFLLMAMGMQTLVPVATWFLGLSYGYAMIGRKKIATYIFVFTVILFIAGFYDLAT